MKKLLIIGALLAVPLFAFATGFPHEEPTLYDLCHNTIDDDNDGYIDLLDSQCAEFRPICETGFHSNEVFECVENAPTDPVCVLPEILVEHQCQLPENEECPSGTHQVENSCIPDVIDLCPEEGVQTELPCAPVIPVCEEDEHLSDNQCVPDVEIPTCTENQTLVENVCVDNQPVDPTCSESQHLDNHECVNNPTPPSGGGSPDTGNPSLGGAMPCVFNGGCNQPPQTPVVSGNGGITVPTQCKPLLISYMRIGRHNDPEDVKRLQGFLNGQIGSNLPLDGFFSRNVEEQVKIFQALHASEILSPWEKAFGKTAPSGIVFILTRFTVNKIYCASVQETHEPLHLWNLN